MKASNSCSPEVRERVTDGFRARGRTRLAAGGDRLDRGQDRLHAETLRLWVRQAERVAGRRSCPTSAECERVKVLERENRELRQAN